MTLAYLIAAFSCGVLASTMGGCASFVLAGLVGLAGMGVSAAMNAAALASPELAMMMFPDIAGDSASILTAVYGNLGPVIDNISFGAVFGPAIAFTAPLWAGTYARKRNYITGAELADAMCWFPLLEPYQRVDVLLVGGVGGVIGAVLSYIVTGVLQLGVDGAASAVFISCILCKLIVDKKLISPRTEEGKKLGSRYNPNQVQAWFPYFRKASIRYTMSIFVGACFAYAERALMLNPLTFSTAHIIGFIIGAFGVIFLMMGFNIQVLPPISASACFVVKGMVMALGNTPEAAASVSAEVFMLWGAAGACLGVTACHFLIQTFSIYSDVYIDPAAAGIILGSFVGFAILPSRPQLASSVVVPCVIIALAIIYSVIEYAVLVKPKEQVAQ